MKMTLVLILHYFAIHHHYIGGADNLAQNRSYTTSDTGTIDLSLPKFRQATLIQNDSLTVVRNKEDKEITYYFIRLDTQEEGTKNTQERITAAK